jgi:hypothetical protein
MMTRTPDLKSSLLSIAYHAGAISSARQRAQKALDSIKPLLIGLDIKARHGSAHGQYRITDVELDADGDVRAFGRKITTRGKLGLLSRDLGTISAQRLRL